MKKVEVSPALARKVAANTAAISDTREDICYIVDGDQSEVTIPSGSIFRLINSTVTGRSDGLYTSAAAIPASTSIDATYFNESAPLSGGVSNLLNSKITNVVLFSGTAKGDTDTGSLSEAYMNFEYLLIYFGIYTYQRQPVLIRTADITQNQYVCSASFLGNSDGGHGKTSCNVNAWLAIKFTSSTAFAVSGGYTNQYVAPWMNEIVGIGRISG